MELSCRFVPPPTLTAYPLKISLLVKHGLDVVMPIWQVPWVWHNVTPSPPWKLLAKPWDQIIHDCNRCLIGLMSVPIFNPAFIFRSTRVGGSMSTINNKTDKESFWKISLLMTTTWPSSAPPDVNTVFQFTMLLLLLLFLAGCTDHLQVVQDRRTKYHIISHLII